MSLSERLARQAGGPQQRAGQRTACRASPPAAPTRSPMSAARVHDALLDTLGPKLYDANLSSANLSSGSPRPSRRCWSATRRR